MCGIVAIIGSVLTASELRKVGLEAGKRIRHRGPDWSGIIVLPEKGLAIEHERLSIVDPESGAQPLQSEDKRYTLAVNGEVYNHEELKRTHLQETNYEFQTKSDCEVIIPLYAKYNIEMVHFLRGMFSFVLYDKEKDVLIAVRDHMGITPLYYGYATDGSIWFASEMKAIEPYNAHVQQFPPGHYFSTETNEFVRWYQPIWMQPKYAPSEEMNHLRLRNAFEDAVGKRMMSDVPWGVLLSGGLDSSLVASVALRKQKALAAEGQTWSTKLHSFTIGLKGSPDVIAAQKVADFLGTIHHSYTYTIQEGLDAVKDVIYHLETYDVTTVRASTPMFLMSRKIKSMGIKMVLSGEGADEVFGGYLYFYKAPSPEAFHKETVDKVKGLYQYDCLRANKSTAAWGVEARVPFLDADFLDVAMSINAADKMPSKAKGRMEKYVLRKAFDTPDDPYLPEEILWRQKEQFSDGVGYNWIDTLKEVAERDVSDAQMKHADILFPYNTPATKEAYMYRSIFDEHFPREVAAKTVPGGKTIACSTAAAIEWDANFKKCLDPSGRAVMDVHDEAYEEEKQEK